jgi:threonine synthase
MMKDESGNPTGSFKARGMSAAISKAKEFGITQCCTPTAGNAGSAMAAYCAKGGIKAKVYMPMLTPKMFLYDTQLMGAEVVQVDGSIRDAGLLMQQENKDHLMWDLSTMKEPFRLEGKKTMGYEIAEQLNWQLPDVILYPTGGGTGLIGIWKAFQEMLQMGWISYIPTRMVAVQLAGCDPIVKAYEASNDVSQLCEEPLPTAANGLRVPKAFADKLILDAIYQSEGFAVRVSENDMLQMIKKIAESEGHFISPEGAALFCGLQQSLENGHIRRNEKIVVINTGSGYKYVENLW